MNDDISRGPADRLVDTDAGISESHLKEFRMGLEQSVHTLEQTAYNSQRNTIRFFFGMIVCQAVAYLLTAGGVSPRGPGVVLAVAWSAVSFGVLIGFIFSLVNYWTKHRPTLERARTDLQIAMFGELQREIAELRGDLERGRAPK
jgi:hypothetical protein